MKTIPDIIKIASRNLRKSMTKAEKILWEKLRANRFENEKFLRQNPLYVFRESSGLDRYIIPDFICYKYKLIIELDGSVHNLKEVYILDKEKQKILENLGYKVLRVRNEEIFEDIDGVLRRIKENF